MDYQWDSCEIQWDYSSKEVFRSQTSDNMDLNGNLRKFNQWDVNQWMLIHQHSCLWMFNGILMGFFSLALNGVGTWEFQFILGVS